MSEQEKVVEREYVIVGFVSQLSAAEIAVRSSEALPLLSRTNDAEFGAVITGAVTSSIVTVILSCA